MKRREFIKQAGGVTLGSLFLQNIASCNQSNRGNKIIVLIQLVGGNDGLNTLILATPKKNIIQSIGRIMRKPIKEGDVNPLIVDIIDDLSVFPNWSNPSTKYYKTNKYTIHEYKAMNDKMISLKDYMVKHNLIKNITPDVDFRKEYIVSKYGLDEYNFQKDTDFYDFPDEIFNYSCNLNDIFEIKHNYEEEIKEMTITI